MKPFETESFKPFDMFNNQWGLVTAGPHDHFNACTIGWGSLETLWGGIKLGKPVVTVYVNPARYTWEFLKDSDYFTVSFFPEEYRKAMGYLGSHSGRDGDKIKAVGLTSVPLGEGVAYKEANLTFVCRKLYQDTFHKEKMSADMQQFQDQLLAFGYNKGELGFSLAKLWKSRISAEIGWIAKDLEEDGIKSTGKDDLIMMTVVVKK